MLDDECHLIGDDEPCYDYIGIMKELVIGNKRRDSHNMFDVSDATLMWLMSVLEVRLSAIDANDSKRKLSDSSRKMLKERIDNELQAVTSM